MSAESKSARDQPTRSLNEILGRSASRRIARWARVVEQIEGREAKLQAVDDGALRKESLSLRYRAKSGEPLEQILPEAYALVREAARRTLGMRHYPVQLLGGVAIHHRSIAEMQTGEGKTLTATLPLYLAALTGKGAHLATANDYLARRDAEWMEPIYNHLGMTVGIVESQQPSDQRRAAYSADVTYGTAKEFGFDFLRDRLLKRRAAEGQSDLFGAMLGELVATGEKPVQRELVYLLVDEADSTMIDEARTPLVISALPGENERIASEAYRWAAEVAPRFEKETHFTFNMEQRAAELTAAGRRLTRELPKPDAMHAMGMYSIYEYIERAIKVELEIIRDRHYVVRDGEIVIVDEFTGRLAEGRKWRAGLHQAIEACEHVEVTFETGQAARITIQDFVLRYGRHGGMTGTALTSARELKSIYQLQVVTIPTNRPPVRRQLPELVYPDADSKWKAVADEVAEIHATGRPVLIGTRSIDKSETLSELLGARGIEHEVLNAKQLAREAEIVAAAGAIGRVTVSTNMAGRGTDIKLDNGVAALGGMHVICTELHESQRIDRQLIGRCGRQGDPGTFRQFLAMDDDILREGFGPQRADKLRRLTGPHDRFAGLFRRAQARIERRHFRQRKVLLYHEKQRKKVQVQMGQDPYLDAPG